jgi:hypothetical protein
MITVKQILEHYNIVTEKASNDTKNLVALVHAGLLEESKLNILNRALSKPVNMMTEAEKKSLQGVVESLASQVISEKQDYLSKLDTSRSMSYPSDKEIPAVIILKRKAIRVYPDNQKVALYYSQALDRYISIPYGKNSKALDMTLNEKQLDEISQETATRAYVGLKKKSEDEDLSPAERRKAAATISRMSKMMKRNIETSDGQKIRTWAGPTAVKRAKFISASPDEKKKMAMGLSAKERADTPGATKAAVYGTLQHGGAEGVGAAAGALIGTGVRQLIRKIRGPSDKVDPAAKTIKPGKIKAELQKTQEVKPTEVPIVKPPEMPKMANRMTGKGPPPMMKESFRKHLEEKRQEKLDEVSWEDIKDGAKKAAEIAGDVTGVNDVVSAVGKAREGDYSGAAWDAAKGVGKGLLTVGTGGAAGAAVTGARVGLTALKAGRSVGNAARRATVAARTSTGGKIAGGIARGVKNVAKGAAGLAGAAASAVGGSGGTDEPLFKPTEKDYQFGQISQGPSATVSKSKSSIPDAGDIRQQQIAANIQKVAFKESNNNLDIMKQIIEQNIPSHTLYISETPITINKRVAKKVVDVYESLNRQNKKKIEKMLNEDAVSFKKAINFAIKA